MTEIKQLILQLREARLKQADAKAKLLARQHNHDIERSKVYLQYAKEGHYQAGHRANVALAVIAAKEALDQATLEHYRCWIECNQLTQMVSVTHSGYSRLLQDEWAHNQPDQDQP